MGQYDRTIKTAHKLIKKFGMKVIWRVIEDPEPADDSTPWLVEESSYTDHDVDMCFVPIGWQEFETLTYMNRLEIPKGLYMGLMGAVPFLPSMKDVVIRDGRELRIFNVDILAPNEQTILYTVIFQT